VCDEIGILTDMEDVEIIQNVAQSEERDDDKKRCLYTLLLL
jgi:hypothetical protein